MNEYIRAYMLTRLAERQWWKIDALWQNAEATHDAAKELLRKAADNLGAELTFTTHYERRP
jgi:predicted NBD/HSP70 family sugar kinase